MHKRITKFGAAVAAVAALAVGGAALASAGQKANAPAPPGVSIPVAPASPDNGTGSEQAGDQPDSQSEQSSESGPSDGPGGYADANPNADTQQQGEN